MTINKKIPLLMMVLAALFTGIRADDIKHFQGKKIVLLDEIKATLIEKINRAGEQFSREGRGEYYLAGYSFHATSRARISGNYIDSKSEPVSRIYRDGDRLVVRHFGRCVETDDSNGTEIVERDVIMLFKRSGKDFNITDVSLLNPDSSYRLSDIPLYWLGRIDTGESLDFLVNTFKSTSDTRFRKQVLPAVGLHSDIRAMDFLYAVVRNTANPEDLRKNAVFWMGASRHPRGLIHLKKLAARETDYTIRKQVVFAFYMNGSAEADRILIGLARNDREPSIRKKAIFWLGQRASKASIRALKEVIENENEITVKSSAVFAISQLPRDKSVPILIDIARSHRSPKIRKKAIFWLGEIGDERAIDFFEDILLK